MKLKVVHVIHSLELGGVQTGIIHSVQKMATLVDLKILVLTNKEQEWIKHISPEIKQHIITIPTRVLPWGWIKGFFMLRKMKPDVVISSLWKTVPATYLHRSFTKKTKLFTFLYCVEFVHAFDRFFQTMLTKRADHYLMDSVATRDFFINEFGEKKTYLVSCLFPPTTVEAKPLELDNNVIKLVFIGRLAPQKNLKRALEFCRKCIDSGININFTIYGKGGEERELRELARELDIKTHVHFKGVINPLEIEHILPHFHFMLQLSDFEGMALSVCEGLNAGLVPIVTPAGEIRHYTSDGTNAIVLEHPYDQNLDELVKKFAAIIKDPAKYQHLSRNAIGTFYNYPTYDKTLMEAFDDALGKDQ